MKITKEMFPDYSIVRHTSYGREVDYAQVGFINISERDIAALLNGEILDVVGDIPILIRFQHNDNLTFGDWFIGSKLFKITVSLFAVPAGLILLMIIIQTIIWTVKLITCGCAV